MNENHGPWTIRSSRQVYQNQFITVVEDQVIQPDGKPGEYATVQMKPGVCILPVSENLDVFLTRQFRYALGRESLEVPSGGIDPDEPPLQAAQREAREELGIEAVEWTELDQIQADTSIINSESFLFLAEGLTFTQPSREGSETIQTTAMPLADAVQKVMEGEILHAPSCVLILKAQSIINKRL